MSTNTRATNPEKAFSPQLPIWVKKVGQLATALITEPSVSSQTTAFETNKIVSPEQSAIRKVRQSANRDMVAIMRNIMPDSRRSLISKPVSTSPVLDSETNTWLQMQTHDLSVIWVTSRPAKNSRLHRNNTGPFTVPLCALEDDISYDWAKKPGLEEATHTTEQQQAQLTEATRLITVIAEGQS